MKTSGQSIGFPLSSLHFSALLLDHVPVGEDPPKDPVVVVREEHSAGGLGTG